MEHGLRAGGKTIDFLRKPETDVSGKGIFGKSGYVVIASVG
jgi:hypothetical protein